LPKDDDTGQVTTGQQTLADSVLTMTDSKGAPVRKLHTGERIPHRMKLGVDATTNAKQLALKNLSWCRARRQQRQRDLDALSIIRPQGFGMLSGVLYFAHPHSQPRGGTTAAAA
jgi:hypothetical protein